MTASTIGGTATAVTDATGQPTFTNLSDIGVAGPHGLAFDTPGLQGTSFLVTLTTGP